MAAVSSLFRRLLRKPAHALVDHVPLGVWKKIFPKDVITLCYHVVSDEELPHIKFYRYKSVAQFEADLAYIQQHHRFIGYHDVVRQRLQNTPLPPNGFFLTFDDGLTECFTIIRPTLLKRGISGAFFVTTNFIDSKMIFFENTISLCVGYVEKLSDEHATELVRLLAVEHLLNDPKRLEAYKIGQALIRKARIKPPATENHRLLIVSLLMLQQHDGNLMDKFCRLLDFDPDAYLKYRPLYLTEAQIRQAYAEGFTIGAHGRAHLKLRLMASPQAIESEIVNSCDIIRQITGQKKVPFAFPYTGNGLDPAFLTDLLHRYDFIELFFDLQGLRSSPHIIVNRLWADLPSDEAKDKRSLAYQLRQAWSQADIWSRAA